RRWWNERRFETCAERIEAGAPATAGEEMLGARERALETVMLGLRTRDGIDLARLEADTGLDLVAANASLIAELSAGDLVRAGSASANRPSIFARRINPSVPVYGRPSRLASARAARSSRTHRARRDEASEYARTPRSPAPRSRPGSTLAGTSGATGTPARARRD